MVMFLSKRLKTMLNGQCRNAIWTREEVAKYDTLISYDIKKKSREYNDDIYKTRDYNDV